MAQMLQFSQTIKRGSGKSQSLLHGVVGLKRAACNRADLLRYGAETVSDLGDGMGRQT